MRILGVDPGLTRCGLGIIDVSAQRTLTMIHTGILQSETSSELPIRLLTISEGLKEIVDRYQPDEIAIERVFSQHNVRTAMGTAQASAVPMIIAAERDIPVHMYTPTEV